ncbi:uncharacterized protein LOC114964436 isoform X3 [Acropora millepora]|nr:uncharacterized protein LOC114964436 isoform X3 [Acropora millepora]XP_029199602.2 uncharacterized protein LOC114964436 isoform X3 [Acropora millepora]XP_029199603.2 uncharacterized protein LOC114964436 isoform X3 [Acropora millepora]
MIEELLRRFARENFGHANNVPVLHGHSETAKPLSLIIKRKRSIWKRPFAREEMIILGGLEKFVSSDCQEKYLDAVKLKVIEEQVMEKGKNDPVDRHKEFNFDIARVGKMKLSADDNLGDLLLGRVRQEYILDPDLREILSCAVLDADKMIAYQDHELLLMTSVVYSERFEVVDERKQKVEFECSVELPFELSEVLKSKLHGNYKQTLTPPGVAKRNVWGPILFKHCRVQYSQETRKLEIMKGEFVGTSRATRRISLDKDSKCKDDAFISDDDDDEGERNNFDDVDDEDGQVPSVVVADDIFLGMLSNASLMFTRFSLPVLDDFTDQDMRNIERIYKNVLMTTNSREQQKALVKKYLGWFENLLADDKIKILLNEPLTRNDCSFLRSLFVPALPGQDTLDFTKVKRAEIHGCGFILKLLDELSDEEWKELGISSN